MNHLCTYVEAGDDTEHHFFCKADTNKQAREQCLAEHPGCTVLRTAVLIYERSDRKRYPSHHDDLLHLCQKINADHKRGMRATDARHCQNLTDLAKQATRLEAMFVTHNAMIGVFLQSKAMLMVLGNYSDFDSEVEEARDAAIAAKWS